MENWRESLEWAPPLEGPYADEHQLIAAHFDQLDDIPPPPEDLLHGDPDDGALAVRQWAWPFLLPLGPRHTEVGRAILAADLRRRQNVAVAATLLRIAAARDGTSGLVGLALRRLSGAVDHTEGFTYTAAGAAEVVGALGVEGHGLDTDWEVNEILDRVATEELGEPSLLCALGLFVRRPCPEGRLSGFLHKRVWDLQRRPLRVVPCSPWAARILEDDDRAGDTERDWLRDLVDHAAKLGRTPSVRWRRGAAELLDRSPGPFSDRFARWVETEDRLGLSFVGIWENRLVLRGLVWVAALAPSPPLDALQAVGVGCYTRRPRGASVNGVYHDPGVGNEVLRALAELGEIGRLRQLRGDVAHDKSGRAYLDRLIGCAAG